MPDINLTLGVKPDFGELNRELTRVRRTVENKLKGITLDISGASVSSLSRGGRIQRGLGQNLLGAGGKERIRAQALAAKAFVSQLNTLNKELSKSTQIVQKLTDKRAKLLAIQNNGAEAAKNAGTSLSKLRGQIALAGKNLESASRKRSRLNSEIDRTRTAFREVAGFFGALNAVLGRSADVEARFVGTREGASRTVVNNLNSFARALAVAERVFRKLQSVGGRGGISTQQSALGILPPAVSSSRSGSSTQRIVSAELLSALKNSSISLTKNAQGVYALNREESALTVTTRALVAGSSTLAAAFTNFDRVLRIASGAMALFAKVAQSGGFGGLIGAGGGGGGRGGGSFGGFLNDSGGPPRRLGLPGPGQNEQSSYQIIRATGKELNTLNDILAAIGRVLAADTNKSFGRLNTEAIRIEKVLNGVSLGFRRTATDAERAQRALERFQQNALARGAFARGAAGAKELVNQKPSVDTVEGKAQERSFANQRREAAKEQTRAQREAAKIIKQSAADYARQQFDAGATVQEVAQGLKGAFSGTILTANQLRMVIGSEAVNAAKRFADDFAKGFSNEPLKKIDEIVKIGAEKFSTQLGLAGGTLEELTTLLREKLAASINKRVNEDLKFAEQTAKDRVAAAKKGAKDLGEVSGSDASLAGSGLLPDAAELQRVIKLLAKRYEIAGAGLADAANAYREAYIAARKKFIKQNDANNRKEASAIDRLVGEVLKEADQKKRDSQKAALENAKVLAGQAASKRRLDPGQTKASLDTLNTTIDVLSKRFGLSFSDLTDAMKAFAKEFERQRLKTFKDAEREALKIQDANDAIASAKRQVADAERRRAQDIRNRASRENLGDPGQQIVNRVAGAVQSGNGGSAFRGLAQQLNALDLGQAQGVIRAITGQGAAAAKSGVQLQSFSKTIANSNPLVRKYAARMDIGSRAAFEFGVEAQRAAGRLAAWATPSIFIFQVIGALREALDTMIKLDTQLRRLEFFQGGDANPFVVAGKAAEQFDSPAKRYAANLRTIIDQAKETGLSVDSVTESIVTLQRVGQKPFKLDADTGQISPAPILEAVQGLVRLEGGALNAGRAAELLNSILKQFNLDADSATQVAASLAAQSRNTSFDVDRLGVVVTGVGSAFRSLQNLTIDETLAIAGVAAKRLGTNASRTRTALRQLSTLFVRFGKQIEEATGVQVANDNGQLIGVESLFKALKEVNKLRGTQGGFALADLFAEAENIPDLQNLAGGVDEFITELGKVNGVAGEINGAFAYTESTVSDFFNQGVDQSQSLESEIQKLKTQFLSLLSSIDAGGAFANLVAGATRFASGVERVVNLASGFSGALKAITAFSFAFLLNGLGKVALGFTTAAFGANKLLEKQQSLVSAVQNSKPGVAGGGVLSRSSTLQDATTSGFITAKKQSEFIKRNNAIFEEQVGSARQLEKIEQKLLLTKKAYGDNTQKISNLEKQRTAVKNKQIELEKKELQLNREITGELRSQRAASAARLKTGLKIAGAALATAALTIGDPVADAVGNAVGSKRVTAGLKGALTGAFTGAAIGSALPVVGTVIGGLIGAGIGGAISTFSYDDEQEKLAANADKKRAEVQRALISRRAQINEKARRELETAAQTSQIEAEIVELKRQAEIAQVNLVSAQGAGLGVAEAEAAVRIANNKLLARQIQLQKEQASRQEATIRREEELISIRKRGERLVNIQSALRDVAVAKAKSGGATGSALAEIELKFNKKNLAIQAAAVNQELNRTRKALAEIKGQTGRGQEEKALAKAQEKLEQKLSDIKLEAVNAEFKQREKILELATEEQRKQIDAWKTAAESVTSAFGSIISAQKEIGSLINRRGGIDINISKAQTDLSNLIPALIGDVTSKVIQAQNALSGVTDSRNAINEQFDLQRVAFLSDLGDKAKVTAVTFAELDAGVELLKKAFANAANDNELTSAQRVLRAQAEANANQLKQRVQVNLELVKIEQARVKAIEGSLRQEISARQALIRSNNELIAAQAKRADSLLNDPNSFLKQIGSISRIRGLFAGQDFTGEAGNKRLRAIVDRLAKQDNGLALLRAVREGLKAAQQQGIRLTSNLSPQQLLDRFLANVLPGSESTAALNSTDEQVTQLKALYASLQENLALQKKLVDDQVAIKQALNQFNKFGADFAATTQEFATKTLGELTARLDPLQMAFDESVARLDSVGKVAEKILKTDEFTVGANLINSTLKEILKALTVDTTSANIADGLKLNETAKRSALLSTFGGASTTLTEDTIGGFLANLQGGLSAFSATQSAEFLKLLSSNGNLGGTQDERDARLKEIETVFKGLNIDRILDIVRNAGGNGISDLSGGSLSAILTSTIRGLQQEDLTTSTANMSIVDAIRASDKLDAQTAKELEKAVEYSDLGKLVAKLTAAQNLVASQPESEASRKTLDELTNKVATLVQAISDQVAGNEVFERIDQALKLLNKERDRSISSSAFKLDDTFAKTLATALEKSTVINGAAASEERKQFIAALEGLDFKDIPKKLDEAIARLERSLADGIKVTSDPVTVEFNSSVRNELTANPELRRILLDAVGGNQAELDRVIRVLGALVKSENDKGNLLEVGAIELANRASQAVGGR